MSRRPPYRAALVGGVATAIHYAMPDFIASRTARGWTKAGVTAVAAAAALPELRAAWTAAREELEVHGGVRPSEVVGSLPAGSKAVLLGVVSAVLAGSVGLVVTAERRAFRRGEARAAAGEPLPHTGPALLYGALASGLWLLPEPSAPHRPATSPGEG